jgi:hypothetical protein
MQKKGLTSMTGGILTKPMITVWTLERRGPRTRDDFPIQVHGRIHELQSVHSTRFRVSTNARTAATAIKTVHMSLKVDIHPIARIHPHQSQRPDVRKQQGLIVRDRSHPLFRRLRRKCEPSEQPFLTPADPTLRDQSTLFELGALLEGVYDGVEQFLG